MSQCRDSSGHRGDALLLTLLWALCAPPPSLSSPTGASPTPPTPLQASPLLPHGTLLFDSVTHGNSLRNCTCAAEITACDELLANLLCSCHTVPRSLLPPGGLWAPGGLTAWVHDPWVLREVLNGSVVSHLRLAFCSPDPPPSQYLALFGLRSLRIHSTKGARYQDQALTISSRVGEPGGPLLHVSLLDVAAFDGLAPLKAYSVSGPPAPALSQHFPHLPLALPDPHGQAAEPHVDSLLTFIY